MTKGKDWPDRDNAELVKKTFGLDRPETFFQRRGLRWGEGLITYEEHEALSKEEQRYWIEVYAEGREAHITFHRYTEEPEGAKHSVDEKDARILGWPRWTPRADEDT